MIELLTTDKLTEYGFNEKAIENLLTLTSTTSIVRNNSGNYYASQIEQKIYSGNDFYLRTLTFMSFPYDNYKIMIPAYYKLNLNIYLKKERIAYDELISRKTQKVLNLKFDKQLAIVKFNQDEIEKATISNCSKFNRTLKHKDIDRVFIDWILKKDNGVIRLSELIKLGFRSIPGKPSTHMRKGLISEYKIVYSKTKGCTIMKDINGKFVKIKTVKSLPDFINLYLVLTS